MHSEYYGLAGAGFYSTLGIKCKDLRKFWLCIGRGCLYQCTFCQGARSTQKHFFNRQSLVIRNVTKVVQDIETLYSRGVQQICFTPDLAMLGESMWKALFDQLATKGIRIGFYNEFNHLVPRGFMEQMAGCADIDSTSLCISPISGNEDVRIRNGRRYSNQEFLQSLGTIIDVNIPVNIYFSYGLLGETPEAFLDTIDLALNILKIYPNNNCRIFFWAMVIDPGSPITIEPDKYGVILENTNFIDYLSFMRERQLWNKNAFGFKSIAKPEASPQKENRLFDRFSKEVIQDLLQASPEIIYAILYFGLIDLRAHDVDDMLIERYQEYMSMDNPEIGILDVLGSAYMNKGQNLQALTVFEKALQYEPEYKLGYFRTAIIYERLADLQKAKKFYSKYLLWKPDKDMAQLIQQHIEKIDKIQNKRDQTRMTK